MAHYSTWGTVPIVFRLLGNSTKKQGENERSGWKSQKLKHRPQSTSTKYIEQDIKQSLKRIASLSYETAELIKEIIFE